LYKENTCHYNNNINKKAYILERKNNTNTASFDGVDFTCQYNNNINKKAYILERKNNTNTASFDGVDFGKQLKGLLKS